MTWYPIINPGHGETTRGKCNLLARPKFFEWWNNRRVAKALAAEMTRRGIPHKNIIGDCPIDVPKKTRAEYVNWLAAKALRDGKSPIMIELHSNASKNSGWGDANGAVVFAHPKSETGLMVARSVSDSIKKSAIYSSDRGVKTSRWIYMLRATQCPTILLELGFHDHRGDLAAIMASGYPQSISAIICNGLEIINE